MVPRRLSYIEVTTGQHFNAFIPSLFRGASGAQFVPLHYYFVLAMDNMYEHLRSGAPLLPSSLTPAEGDRITFSDGILTIPE